MISRAKIADVEGPVGPDAQAPYAAVTVEFRPGDEKRAVVVLHRVLQRVADEIARIEGTR